MIRLDLDQESLRSIRLALSPLWETLGSLALLARYRGAVPSPYAGWVHRARRSVPPELMDLVVRQEAPFLKRALGYVPDPSRSSLQVELDCLRQQGDERGDERLAGLMEEYWNRAIGPHWTSIRSALEEEVLFRGRTLAVHGPEAMLAELGGRVLWEKPRLTAPYHLDLTRTVHRSKLVFVPSVFSAATRIFTSNEHVTAMSYQARATGFFHFVGDGRPTEPTTDRLALLIGGGRARVIRALQVPKTTTVVAESLGFAKSTVSQHLAVLTAAGVVWRQRLGGQVFYQLDRSGFALLEELGD
ncbi:winged helix-turn-helix transcriptional regulator [Streptomyces sp. ISL-10]|uniref:ArsR/SmtB family transcription factor n=1 Tax=Streptomyces sp. ISL-10 TaxID=2819172 RepID=UPI001BE7520E|nr:ArsR family transcriptional regulator [Streptomyces sp. ISL-10]MBT2363969.1 winged helix-turn-helix transcriptional regulator [Streptomyces sp. ISL-10]